MAKTAVERQKAWKSKHKLEQASKDLRKVMNKAYYNKKKATATNTEKLMKQKDARLRKQKSREAARNLGLGLQVEQTTPTKKLSPAAIGKAVRRALTKGLPKSPRSRKAVVTRLCKLESIQLVDTSVIVRCRVSDQDQATVIHFFESEEISRVDPGKKTAQSNRRIIQARRHLLYTISEAYALFKEKYPEIVIGRSKFSMLRPSYIKPYRDLPHNVCVCKYHENFSALHHALSQVAGLDVGAFGSSIQEFISNVCNTDNFQCMHSECPTCMEVFKQIYDIEWDDPEELISYKQWCQHDTTKRMEHVTQEKIVGEALQEMISQHKQFLMHSFNTQTSQAHFNYCRLAASPSNVVLQVDFAENYACSYQDEVQSAHWNNPQVAVFTAVIWYGPTESNIESYAIISDNITHDRYCVNLFLRDIITEHRRNNPFIKSIHIFSDGSACQFKQKYNFSNITLLKEHFQLETLTWTFFATSHGKGAVDGIGAVVKRSVWNEVRSKRAVVRNAESFTALCEEKQLKVIVRHVPATLVEESKLQLDKLWENVKTVKGTHSIHHVEVVGPYQIQWKMFPQQEKANSVNLNGDQPVINIHEEQVLHEEAMHNQADVTTALPEPMEDEADVTTVTPFTSTSEATTPVIGQWVAVVYEQQWLPGVIESIDGSMCKIKFMKIIGPNRFIWPERNDFGNVDYGSILSVMLAHPDVLSYTGRSVHSLPPKEYLRLIELYIHL